MSRASARRRRRDPRAVRVRHYAKLDRDRARRVGVPEVILGEGKTVEHLLGIVDALAARGMGALISRPTSDQIRALRRHARPRARGARPQILAEGRLVRLPGPLGARYRHGVAAILTAGTSDVPLAEEARALLVALGIRVVRQYDIGVAGLHRLLAALHRLEARRPEVYLVFAGREGALPTIVAGLVRAPVVGIPASIGYGRGGRGEAALNAMLQSCAPLAVVNIDAAIPAALFAAQHFVDRATETSQRPVSRRTPPSPVGTTRGLRMTREKGF
ncbi:MAG TPA: nickel pincer cofactor biosynthesis protein LarB [Thermoplasmata archaeon]|nr:nickel pincer cofactor biosynthesis protein LarB [Thermoplasmata archaeon]